MYLTNLRKLLNKIRSDAKSTLENTLEVNYVADGYSIEQIISAIEILKKKWSEDNITPLSRNIARMFVKSCQGFTNRTFDVPDQPDFGIDYLTNAKLQEELQLAVSQNVALIKSIAQDELGSIEKSVLNSIRLGVHPTKVLEEALKKGVSYSRAKMIARDQSAKTTERLSIIRQKAAGFIFFKWLESDDERVRSTHRAVAEKVTQFGVGVYKVDDPPLVGDRKLLPAEDYQCRCTAIPMTVEEVNEFRQSRGLPEWKLN